jgi:hypothetical protein
MATKHRRTLLKRDAYNLRLTPQRSQKVIDRQKSNPFLGTIPVEMYGFILNCLHDDEILRFCLFVNKEMREMAYRFYIIKSHMYFTNLTHFSYANWITLYDNNHLEKAVKKCKRSLDVDIDDKVQGYDFKKLRISCSTDQVREDVHTINIKTPYLHVDVYPSTRHFIGPENLDIMIIQPEDNEFKNPDFTQYTFPSDLKQLKIRYEYSGSDIINFSPDDPEEHLFDYNKFFAKFDKLTECILLFDCAKMKEKIIVPPNLVKFGILPMKKKNKQIIDLSQASKLQELVLWNYEEDPAAHAYWNIASLTLIPPLSKYLKQLTIMSVELREIHGFDEFNRIDKLIIYDGQGEQTFGSYHGVVRMLIYLCRSKVVIKHLVLINFNLPFIGHTTTLISFIVFNATTEHVSFYSCNFPAVTMIFGDGLKSIDLEGMRKEYEIRSPSGEEMKEKQGWVIFPDHINTITVDPYTAQFVKHFPNEMKHLQVSSPRRDKTILEKIKESHHVRDDCQMSFVDKNTCYYEREVELSVGDR